MEFAFSGITSLVFALACLIALFKMMSGTQAGLKEGLLWAFGATLFQMFPAIMMSWLKADDPTSETQWSTTVGSWYGGGHASNIINSLANIGVDLGNRVWAAIIATYLPQIALLGWGIHMYWRQTKGDPWALLLFFIIGGIAVPLIVGGPSASFPKAVIDGASGLMSTIVKDISGETQLESGYTLRDVEIARRSARFPADTRHAIILFHEMSKYHQGYTVENNANVLTPEGETAYGAKWVTHRGTNATKVRGSDKGPDGYMYHPELESYYTLPSNAVLWTDDLSEQAIWNRLSNGKGQLRGRAEIGYDKIKIWGMGNQGSGVAADQLQSKINALYDYYNKRVKGQTKDEILSLMRIEATTNPGSETTPLNFEQIEERLQLALDQGLKIQEAPLVEPLPDPSLHLLLQGALKTYYQNAAERFTPWRENVYGYANYLYDPDFYGVLMFAPTFNIPLNNDSPGRPLAEELTKKSDWSVFMTAPGLQQDLKQGINNPGAIGSLSSDGFWNMIFEAPAWLGFKILNFINGIGLPIIQHTIPYVVGVALLFLMAAYPVYACTALFLGRWTVMLDWAKALMWVMSWAACYQIGVQFTESMPIVVTGDPNNWSESLSKDIFSFLGMFIMASAPALTGFVLSATAGAMQNIGSSVSGFGFKTAGAAWAIGTTAIVAVAGGIMAGAGTLFAPALAGLGAKAAAGGAGSKAASAASAASSAAEKATQMASAATQQGGLMERFSQGMMSAGQGAMQAGRMAQGMSAMAMSRWDTFMGTGAGAGANAMGPIDPGERWGGRRGGGGGVGNSAGEGKGSSSQKPGDALTISATDQANDSTMPSLPKMTKGGTGGAQTGVGGGSMTTAAFNHDRTMQAGDEQTPKNLGQSEMLHTQAAHFAQSAGNPKAAAVSASHAAEAAVAGGSSSAGSRIAAAEQHVAQASVDGTQSASIALAGARTQLAKAELLSSQGDSAGAAQATSAAAKHLQQATATSVSGLGVAMTAGDDVGRTQQVATLAGIVEAGRMAQGTAGGNGNQAMSAVITQASSALSAHTQTGGAPALAAQGFSDLLTGDSQSAESNFRTAATQSTGGLQRVMLRAATTSLGGDASVNEVAQVVTTEFEPNAGLAVHPYATGKKQSA